MNTKAKPTPGPWVSPGTDAGNRAICAAINGKRRTLAHVYGGDDCSISEQTRDANAAFIVRACNSHDELVAALEFVNKWIALRSDRGDKFPSQLTNTVSAALAKAKGEA